MTKPWELRLVIATEIMLYWGCPTIKFIIRGHSFGLHSPSVPHESHSSRMPCIWEKDPPKHILDSDCIRQLV